MTKISHHFDFTNSIGVPVIGLQLMVEFNRETGTATPCGLMLYSPAKRQLLNFTLMMHDDFFGPIVKDQIALVDWHAKYHAEQARQARIADNIKHGIIPANYQPQTS